MSAKNCPFCGAAMNVNYALSGQSVTGYSHPSGTCLKAGVFIGGAIIDRWNNRVESVHYEVVDGHPVFNSEGRGLPADAEFVGECLKYYRNNA